MHCCLLVLYINCIAMKRLNHITCLLALLLVISCQVSAQKSKTDTFPTYEQIRGNKAETFDYVGPGGNSWTVVRREMVVSPYFNAFTYPEGSAVYYLNGKRMKSKKRAEQELNEKCGNVESVSIGPVETNGKRIIRIDYEVKRID
jgi:hypothetical protein